MLNPEDLQRIAARTQAHYERHAHGYWEGPRGHDVSQNIVALLQHMPGTPPFDRLDFGCGPGRDPCLPPFELMTPVCRRSPTTVSARSAGR